MAPLLFFFFLASTLAVGMQPAAGSSGCAPATIIVTLPADAKLMVNDGLVPGAGSTRLLTTPLLELGRCWTYTIQAQWRQDRETIIVQKDIAVRAGCETDVALSMPEHTAASAAAGQACGARREILSYYSAPEAPMPAIEPPTHPQLEYLGGEPVRPGIGPSHRPDPSDPFYHSGQ